MGRGSEDAWRRLLGQVLVCPSPRHDVGSALVVLNHASETQLPLQLVLKILKS